MPSGGKYSAPTVNVNEICRKSSSQEGLKLPSDYKNLMLKNLT